MRVKRSGRSMGRLSIFRDKAGGDRVQGVITKVGSAAFEAARKRLGVLVGRPGAVVSDGDTVEFLSRGEANTLTYLKEHQLE
mgnify:CR=1 FL=1